MCVIHYYIPIGPLAPHVQSPKDARIGPHRTLALHTYTVLFHGPPQLLPLDLLGPASFSSCAGTVGSSRYCIQYTV